MDELCVYGWIRENCNDFEMPMDLQKLCILMYVIIMDSWNTEIHTKNVIIDNDENIAKVIKHTKWQHAYGTFIIKKGMMMTWRFKLDGDRDSRPIAIYIGIVSRNKMSSEMHNNKNFFDKEHGGYGFYTYLSKLRGIRSSKNDYEKRCYSGDAVKTTLDLTQKENKNGLLLYEINDKSFGVAVDYIDIGKEYCLAVKISNSSYQSIQIIE